MSAPAPRRGPVAPDFLTELFRNPLDPGYAAAARRRERTGAPSGARRALHRALAALTCAAIGLLLVAAYRQTVADEPTRSKTRGELVEQVQRRRAETDRLQQRADDLRGQVAALRERGLSGAALARLRSLEATTGLAAVRGDGARITLADGPTRIDPVTGKSDTKTRVQDSDLQLAANALWAAGAEAVAVNGQRLTATSTIRQAGEAILVDFRPVGSPYEVVAIGPGDLAQSFTDGYAGRFFRELVAQYGMSFAATPARGLTLEAATELKLRYAQPVAPPGAAPASGAPSSGSPSPSQSEGG